MFQYAVGYAIAQRMGRQLYLDLADLIILRGGRKYQLNHFSGPLNTKQWGLISSYSFLFLWIIEKRISKKLSAILFRIFGFRVMQTPEIFHTVPMFLDPPDNTSATRYVAGCYGLLAYFSDCADAVRKHFELVKPLSGKNKTYFEKFSSMDSTVSIHVRRTDYLLAANGTPVLNFEYYLNAIEEVKLHETNPVWVIFSDDLTWCKEKFAFLSSAIFVDGNEATPWEDMYLISACHHHIIANSTFSWWGAFLGHHPSGVTLYPKAWFRGAPTTPDMVSPDWIPVPSFE